MKQAKIYINGRLIGFHDNPKMVVKELINARRANKIESQVNVSYNEETNEVYVNTDAGRIQRPLIVVENGKSKLTEEMIEKLKTKEISFDDLVEKGVIEFLDAEEEENAYVALTEKELTPEHTHLEIDGIATLSVMTSMIPFVEHNLAGKVLHGAKMFKQAAGLGAINFKLRTDTEGYLLHYPQKCIVKTKTMDLLQLDKRPITQNFVVAVLSYYGINSLDAIVINKGAIDRALGRMAYFRTYESVQQRYPGGQKDKFEIPSEDTVGFLGSDAYTLLGDDGLAELETYVTEKKAIIGKTSPPRFLEEISEFGVVKEKRREASTTVRKKKDGFVDTVIITEDADGNKLVKVKIRSDMKPLVGDKFSSKHGQKGVLGLIVPEEDMPFTEQGIKPDLILNPHSIPSRMTIGHLLEMLAGKSGCLQGQIIDGTSFNEKPKNEIEEILLSYGFRPDGKERFYEGTSGRRIEGTIFTGVVAYRRLYHVVTHKMQARARGPVQMLTRQPTEGKEKEGGLRFGEMEGETLVGHGASMLLYEKLVEDSDKTIQLVCEKCGSIGINDKTRNKKYCPVCKSTQVYEVEMNYGFKLLLDELKALGVYTKINIKDKV